MTNPPSPPTSFLQLVGGKNVDLSKNNQQTDPASADSPPLRKPPLKSSKERFALRITILEEWLKDAIGLMLIDIQQIHSPKDGKSHGSLSSSAVMLKAVCDSAVVFDKEAQLKINVLPQANYYYSSVYFVKLYSEDTSWKVTGRFMEGATFGNRVTSLLTTLKFTRTYSPGGADLSYKVVSGRPCFELNIDSLGFGIPPIKVSTIPTRFWRYKVNDDTYGCDPEHHNVFPIGQLTDENPTWELDTLPPELARVVEKDIVSIALAEKQACALIEEFSPNFY